MNLFSMSIQAGILIAVILILRFLAGNRLPKNTFLALWGVTLLRLLIPVSLPSPFSVYSIAGRGGSPDPLVVARDVPHVPISIRTGQSLTTTAGAGNENISIWALLWGVGMCLLFLFFVICYIHGRRRFLGALPVGNAYVKEWLSANNLRRTVAVRQTDRVKAPLVYGIFRPVILMPKQTDWEDEQALQFILQHELVHIKRLDGVTKILLAAALCIHWFNPMVWAMYLLANRDLELSCDEAVLRSFGEKVKSAYADTLLRMEEQKSGLLPFTNNFSRSAMEERIRAIMKYRNVTIGIGITACVVVTVLTVCLATNAIDEGSERMTQTQAQSEGEDVLKTEGSVKTVSASTEKAEQSDTVEPADRIKEIGRENSRTKRTSKEHTGSIVIETFELRHYANGWPYLHDKITNHTDKGITKMQYGMLAYDKEGEPLKIHWNLLDSEDEMSYENLVETQMEIQPDETMDEDGGWSLYDEDTMPEFPKVGEGGPNHVAYALYQIRQVTFEDGSVWDNPNFDSWLNQYKGKTVDVTALKTYYPHEITLSN